MQDHQQKNTCASVPFRTIAHIYDPDDPSPEDSRELSDRAEKAIFLTVLEGQKGAHKALCSHLEILLPAPDLAPDRLAAITRQYGPISSAGRMR